MKEDKDIRFQLKEEHILWLLKGKKVIYVFDDIKVSIEPPQGYLTFTYEEIEEIKKTAYSNGWFDVLGKLLERKEGQDVIREIGENITMGNLKHDRED